LSKSVFISAGEPSGDVHASGLISAIQSKIPDISIWGLGGDRLGELGAELIYHVSRLSSMGFAELAGKMLFFRKVYKSVIQEIEKNRPDAAILVDYPGMNFRFGDRLSELGIPFIYYILPQVWAWHESRVEKMMSWRNARFVSILPFEQDYFKKRGLHVDYFGHPLVDTARPDTGEEKFRSDVGIESNDTLLAILPGSRTQEIRRILPVMLKATKAAQKEHNRIIPVCRPSNDAQVELCKSSAGRLNVELRIYRESVYNLLTYSDLTLVTSGTATLEAAICGAPSIVLYRTNPLTYYLARRLVKVPNIAMANLIAGETIYPELIQSDANPENICAEIARYVESPQLRESTRSRIAGVSKLLGDGEAYLKAAERVAEFLEL